MRSAAAGPLLRSRPCGAAAKRPAAALLLAAVALPALLAGCKTSGSGAGAVQPAPIASEQLIGLTPTALVEALGSPRTLRRERPAEIWQYRGDRCVLDVFLYEAPEGPQVIHLEARGERAEPIAPQYCLAALPRAAGV